MKSILEQLSTYKSVHLNGSNVKTHFVGIPLILWAVILVLSKVSFQLDTSGLNINVNLADTIAVFVVAYYLVMHIKLGLFATFVFAPVFYSAQWASSHEQAFIIAFVVFVIGWVFQFIGHAYEKAKPAFVDDLNQLLIGPLFLIAEIYFFLKLDRQFADDVHQLAIKKRELFEEQKVG